MIEQTSLFGQYSFLNTPVIIPPKHPLTPKNLKEFVIVSSNLKYYGCKNDYIPGGGFNFTVENAYNSALGEFCERYSCSFIKDNNLIYGSYQEIKDKYKCLSIEKIRYYTSNQYKDPTFRFQKLEVLEKIYWKWCKDYLNDSMILIPYFMVGLENIDNKMFHFNTSTGSSAHQTIDKAVFGGFMECIERDAFCKFWYQQKFQKNNKLSTDYILTKFPNNDAIQSLFNNKKVRIVTFNLCEYSYAPTFAVFILFKHRGQLLHSVASATRLQIEDAIVKATLEAYQGIEYAIMCTNNYREILSNIQDYSILNEFDKHFAFYNINPHLREKSPILQSVMNWESDYDNDLEDEYSHHIQQLSVSELKKIGINQLFYTEMTTPDVEQLGIKVLKVITPELHLLTGHFKYPYLGLFGNHLDLFTEYPHPFP